MKSDREFLDGIYEKAKKYEETKRYEEENSKSTFQKRYHSFKPIYMAAILVLMVTSGVVLYQQPWNEETVEPKPRNEVSITPEASNNNPSEEDGQTTSPVAPATEQLPSQVRGLPFSLPLVEEVILEGKVTEIVQGEQTVYLQVNKVHVGTVPETETIALYVSELENLAGNFIAEDEILVYVQQNTEGKWILSQGMGSKYDFVKEADGVRYFENNENIEVDTSTFQAVQ